MKKKNQVLMMTGIAVATCVALAVLPEGSDQSQRSTRPFLEKAYEVLDNPRWYENDPFLVRDLSEGKLPEGRPKYAPSAIEGTEWSCIRGVLGEYARDPAVGERLKKYAEHHNRKVAIEAVAGLVREGEWTKESATEFAQQQAWTVGEIQQMVRLGRTPLEAAYEILDDPRWYENDPLIGPEPADPRRREEHRAWARAAIDRRESDAIRSVFSEYGRNPAVGERLKKYAEHQSRNVAIYVLVGLVRRGEWTRQSAVEFAEQHAWTAAEIQALVHLLGESVNGS